ncbi:hypothetical protein HYH02_000270 [Chlamydomonas schloesseri]|uniref:Protein kinase domain-containing protein n=1 Tax=Chlamydomonas schloesseri TaxID=2026947 RepID=A0A835WMX5_9CHLO|nr:hypothetical protein HYH02_000270 [Chlamydomonas schloesseri]|eukprot:KAG2450168.1 hypothetical protein HYH02_000270 [Chlamydomonas schloesseri]
MGGCLSGPAKDAGGVVAPPASGPQSKEQASNAGAATEINQSAGPAAGASAGARDNGSAGPAGGSDPAAGGGAPGPGPGGPPPAAATAAAAAPAPSPSNRNSLDANSEAARKLAEGGTLLQPPPIPAETAPAGPSAAGAASTSPSSGPGAAPSAASTAASPATASTASALLAPAGSAAVTASPSTAAGATPTGGAGSTAITSGVGGMGGGMPPGSDAGSYMTMGGGGAQIPADGSGTNTATGGGGGGGGGVQPSGFQCMPASALAKEVAQLSWVGHGGYGAVYKGVWQGANVAVKFTVADYMDFAGASAHEAVLSKMLSHPNVVQTFASRVALLDEDFLRSVFDGDTNFPSRELPVDSFRSGEGFGSPYGVNTSMKFKDVLTHIGARPGHYITQMIMEYCDRGSLHQAIAKGLFKSSSKWNNKIALRALLRTAREIAQGMSHLHACRVVHGDLKPGNVLLMSSRADRRGFTAKVSDFGLSTYCMASHTSVTRWSTVSYMAPEAFEGHLTMGSDTFSFGVLLWEMYTGMQPYAGLQAAQIVMGVQAGHLELDWPPDSDSRIQELVEACIARNPAARPTFLQLIHQLTQLEALIRLEAPATESASASETRVPLISPPSGTAPSASPPGAAAAAAAATAGSTASTLSLASPGGKAAPATAATAAAAGAAPNGAGTPAKPAPAGAAAAAPPLPAAAAPPAEPELPMLTPPPLPPGEEPALSMLVPPPIPPGEEGAPFAMLTPPPLPPEEEAELLAAAAARAAAAAEDVKVQI